MITQIRTFSLSLCTSNKNFETTKYSVNLFKRNANTKKTKKQCVLTLTANKLFVKFYFITFFHTFHDNHKKWVSVTILAFSGKFWVAAVNLGCD